MSKKRKYSENYVAFGFTFITDSDGSERPQCFLCGKVLANARFEKSGTLPKFGFIKTQKPCLEASYKVAYRIAKAKKAHTIGETLIKPCALEMTELVCGTEQRKKLEAVSLSNDTISSRIIDISNNILKQVMEELKASPFPFSMQLDESTDVSQCAQLLVYVRYMHADAIKEEFLFCEPLSETTKAADVLEMVNNFFAKQDFNWKKNIGSLCTDGAPAMLGKTSGFASLVKKEAPHIIVTHCFLHRHALASKTLSPALKEILSVSVKIVNFVRARALNNRIFKRLCQEMGAQHEVLLYHTEVRWLSRGQVLKRLMELRKEVSFFLRENKILYQCNLTERSFFMA
ncbi:protein ZBED8-like [Xenia sp. Carnegie-2017]|uniref:protein ZBED8-like n=1 Tax=Xenia sp. Carnegie-2017 TaxID=2897299 RepID=UPI001F033183|nr:protein ZBED8-like [Xenia sp. Carnegie-2017]